MKGKRFREIRTLPWTLSLLLLFFARTAGAHGTGFQLVETGEARAVECYYSSGDPMTYSNVLVYGPGDTDTEFQNGRTDQFGRFAFLPDRPGVWRVIVGDGQGHRLEAEVQVSPSPVPDGEELPDSVNSGLGTKELSSGNSGFGTKGRPLKGVGTLCGISLIFNFFFIAYALKKNRTGIMKNDKLEVNT